MCSAANKQAFKRLIIKPEGQGKKRHVHVTIGDKLTTIVADQYFPKQLGAEINKGPLKKMCVNSVGKTCAKLKEKIFEKYCEFKAKQISLSESIKNKVDFCADQSVYTSKLLSKRKNKNPKESNQNKTKKSNQEVKMVSEPSLISTQMTKSTINSANMVKGMEQIHQLFKHAIRNCEEEKNADNESDPSDDETEKQHPNRRLEMERTQNAPRNTTSLDNRLGLIDRSLQNHLINKTQIVNSEPETSDMQQNMIKPTTRVSVFSRLQSRKTIQSAVMHCIEQNESSDLLTDKTLNTSLTEESKDNNNYEEVQNSEKPELKPSVFSRLGSIQEPKTSDNVLKASKMWMDVMDTSEFWKCEGYDEISCDNSEYEEELGEQQEEEQDYQEMLVDFVFDSLEEHIKLKEETLYERRFKEMLLEPDSMNLINEFYIPPAKVEVFHQKLTENMSAKECLNQVCLARGWPKPEYTLVTDPGFGGFIFSCKLKEKNFTPTKPASNMDLAVDLAAAECLDWLGITVRRGTYGFTEDTYFG